MEADGENILTIGNHNLHEKQSIEHKVVCRWAWEFYEGNELPTCLSVHCMIAIEAIRQESRKTVSNFESITFWRQRKSTACVIFG